LHAHCRDRRQEDYIRALGAEPRDVWRGQAGAAHDELPPVEAYDDEMGARVPTGTDGESSRYGLTDLGSAHRFARDHGRDVRYCWPWAKWLVWNNRFWSRDEDGPILRLAEATVRGMYKEAAAELDPERREALAKCQHRREISVKQTVLKLRSGCLAVRSILLLDLVFHAVAFPLDDDGVRVMEQTVEKG
ncbi:MAG: hypothetical protein ACREUD_05520, partial [Gammaproteobacteria bacterium]